MRIAVLFKRRYMSHDVIRDRYARLYEFPAQLARAGNDVHACCLSYRKADGVRITEQTSAPGSLTWQSFNAGPLLVGGLPWYLKEVTRLTREFRPDVLLGGSDSIHAIVTGWLGKRLGIPYAVDLYDNYESFGLTKIPGVLPLYRAALRSANGIVAVSEPLAEYVQAMCPKVPVTTLESTIDPTVFFPRDKQAARRELGLPDDAILMGIAGSLARSRGIQVLYDAFRNLRSQGSRFKLVLAGNLDSRDPPPDDENILYLGRLAHEQMPVFHSALDVAVICMRDTEFGRYAFPQKAYEVLACRTPLVTAAVGALKRTLESCPQSLYEPDNSASLAEAIQAQVDRPTLPILEIPSWAEQGEILNRFLEDIVARRPRARASG